MKGVLRYASIEFSEEVCGDDRGWDEASYGAAEAEEVPDRAGSVAAVVYGDADEAMCVDHGCTLQFGGADPDLSRYWAGAVGWQVAAVE